MSFDFIRAPSSFHLVTSPGLLIFFWVIKNKEARKKAGWGARRRVGGGGNRGLRHDGCAVTSNYRGWRKKEGVA